MTDPGCVQRIATYRHLAPSDRIPPGRAGVFFDPVDTEAGIWATVDLLRPGCTVLDLGSGSGATARALVRAGAGRVHGVDVSPASVAWSLEQEAAQATAHGRATFAVADYTSASASEVVAGSRFDGPPDVVTSNPPYVPLAPAARQRVSIDGGPDGLRLARVVIGHAAAMGSALAITLGSYSCPRAALRLLAEHGYEVVGVTLSALRLGQHTVENAARILELEASGEGWLLRTDDGIVHYVVVALSCRRATPAGSEAEQEEDVLALIRRACASRSADLEALEPVPAGWSVPIRVLVLPNEPGRHHA